MCINAISTIEHKYNLYSKIFNWNTQITDPYELYSALRVGSTTHYLSTAKFLNASNFLRHINYNSIIVFHLCSSTFYILVNISLQRQRYSKLVAFSNWFSIEWLRSLKKERLDLFWRYWCRFPIRKNCQDNS